MMKILPLLWACLMSCLVVRGEWRRSDNGNGTFTNPVIFADYPDPDIIRVGEDYYMVSSSFTTFPGIPVCHSTDLVNWRIIGYAYSSLPHPNYSMKEGKTAYPFGSWAPFIRYHEGKFYIGFNTQYEGFCLAVSDRPEGGYRLRSYGRSLFDPSMLFDDDGRIYLVHGSGTIFITELSSDLQTLGESVPVYYSAFGTPFEGSHFYKRDGYYYITCTSRGYNGIQTALRSEHVYGPYLARVISADDMNYKEAGLHQGGWVDTPDGESWFFIFQDRDYLGRVPVLQPVTWQGGFPYLGVAENGFRASVTCRKPLVRRESTPSVLDGSDDFDSDRIALKWVWNHIPDSSKWSLTERRGFLRLRPSKASSLLNARNTLTQKLVGLQSAATVRMDVSALVSGDIAGLSILNIPYYSVGLRVRGDRCEVVADSYGTIVDSVVVERPDIVYFRAEVTLRGTVLFSYSLDGHQFRGVGREEVLEFSTRTFLGNKYGIFCYSDRSESRGYVDVDSFEYLNTGYVDNRYDARRAVRAEWYDRERGTELRRMEAKRPMQRLHISNPTRSYFVFDRLDMGTGVDTLCVEGEIYNDSKVDIRCAGPDGEVVATVELKRAKGVVRVPVGHIEGVHALCFCFEGKSAPLMMIEKFWFE